MRERLLRTLSEMASPDHSALIVIDPQRDFCSQDGALARRFGFDMSVIQAVIPRLNSMVAICRDRGIPVFWVREVFEDARMHANQRAMWGSGDEIWVVADGSSGVEWAENLIGPNVDEPIITKSNYDAFQDTDLRIRLERLGVRTLLLTGFTTNVCVETAARHGYMLGYHIVLIEDCAGATTTEEHESAVRNVDRYFGKTTSFAELVELWNSSSIEGLEAGGSRIALASNATAKVAP